MQFYGFCQHFIAFCLYFRFSSGKRQKLYNNLLGIELQTVLHTSTLSFIGEDHAR